MCFFCFTTDLNYDPQKYGYNLRALANFQLGQKLCPNLHDMFYSVLRGSSTFNFDGVASGRLDARPLIGSRVPTNRDG